MSEMKGMTIGDLRRFVNALGESLDDLPVQLGGVRGNGEPVTFSLSYALHPIRPAALVVRRPLREL